LSEQRELVFVGGVAHSGTSVVARLLDAHPRLVALPVAARFHSDARGMPALLAGQAALEEFVERLRERWWNGAGGLGQVVDRSVLEGGLERFQGAYHRDPLEACRDLFLSLTAPAGNGERGLVEASPGNLRQAQTLVRLFPEARFVHVVRDGRDVAAADGAAGGLAAGLRGWAGKLREIEASLRGEEDGMAHPIPAGSLALVVLDALDCGDREAAYGGLLKRLALEDDPQMRSALERGLGPVGRGRWRERASGPAAWAIGRRYRRTLSELDREGNRAAPPLIAAYEALE
jgi:hypothetical protein